MINDKSLNVKSLEKKFKTNGIEIRPFFSPLHIQPPYKKYKRCKSLENSTILSKTGFCLPSSANLNNDTLNKVCNVLNSIININEMVSDF